MAFILFKQTVDQLDNWVILFDHYPLAALHGVNNLLSNDYLNCHCRRMFLMSHRNC